MRSAALAACERLGKYRMPFAWTAVHLTNVISGSNSLEREQSSDKDSLSSNSQSNSLDRKTTASSLEQFKRHGVGVGGSLTRRGSLERKALNQSSLNSTRSDELGNTLDTFKPVTITIANFFKQVGCIFQFAIVYFILCVSYILLTIIGK